MKELNTIVNLQDLSVRLLSEDTVKGFLGLITIQPLNNPTLEPTEIRLFASHPPKGNGVRLVCREGDVVLQDVEGLNASQAISLSTERLNKELYLTDPILHEALSQWKSSVLHHHTNLTSPQ